MPSEIRAEAKPPDLASARAVQTRAGMTHKTSSILATAAVALGTTIAGCSTSEPVDGTSILLVHGAWMGSWAWSDVKARLEARGARVTAVELPGHGDDTTPVAAVSLRAYVDTVEAALDALPAPVMLVGHSMGGMVVTEVADERAARIDRLVYVTAFVPRSGESLIALSMQDADSALGPALTVQMAQGTLAVASNQLASVFCADCSVAASASLASHYRDEPLAPFATPAQLTAGGWAAVPKFYLYADDDRAISPANQHRMTAGITWSATAAISTSHSPFLSDPAVVAEHLADFAGR